MLAKYQILDSLYKDDFNHVYYTLLSSDLKFRTVLKQVSGSIEFSDCAKNFTISEGFLQCNSCKRDLIAPKVCKSVLLDSDKSATLYNIIFDLVDSGAYLIDPTFILDSAMASKQELIANVIVPITNMVFDQKSLCAYVKIGNNTIKLIEQGESLRRNPIYVAIPADKKCNTFGGIYIKSLHINNEDLNVYMINKYALVDHTSYYDMLGLLSYAYYLYTLNRDIYNQLKNQDDLIYGLFDEGIKPVKGNISFSYKTGFKRNESINVLNCEERLALADKCMETMFYSSLFLFRARVSLFYTSEIFSDDQIDQCYEYVSAPEGKLIQIRRD